MRRFAELYLELVELDYDAFVRASLQQTLAVQFPQQYARARQVESRVRRSNCDPSSRFATRLTSTRVAGWRLPRLA